MCIRDSGWLYMIFLFSAFWLSRRADWDIPFTAVTLVSGTVPLLSFWAEHRATRRVRAEAWARRLDRTDRARRRLSRSRTALPGPRP